MSWPPPPESTVAERTAAWKKEKERRLQALKAAEKLPPPKTSRFRPDKFWPARDYLNDWFMKKVRVVRGYRGHGAVKKGAVGVVVDWKDGWPLVWFGEGKFSWKTDHLGSYESVELDRLEKI